MSSRTMISDDSAETKQERIKSKLQKETLSFNQSIGDLEGYDCVECKNRGFFMEIVPLGRNLYTKMVPCECQKIRRNKTNMERSGLSDFLKEKTFDNFKTKNQWQLDLKSMAMEYAEDPQNKWFYVGGATGIGKTHICSAIYTSLINKGYSPRYFRWREEINRIKAVVNDWDAYSEIVKKLKYCDLLYIDDLFWTGRNPDGTKAMPTTADMNFVFEILDYRYLHKEKITIISSELNRQDLYNVDPAIAGRIQERCGKYLLSFRDDPERNYRRQELF